MANIFDFEKAKAAEEAKKAQEAIVPVVEDAEKINKKKEALKKLVQFRGEVPSKNTIRGLPDLKVNEIFWVEMDHKAYVVAAVNKKKVTLKALDETASISTGLTIFDMNKGIVSKEPLFDFSDAAAVDTLNRRICEFFLDDAPANTYLLYGRDIHYVSVLTKKDHSRMTADAVKDIIDSLKNIGDLISMDFNCGDGEKSIEIWVRTSDSPAELLYLFPYDNGVIEI